MYNYTLIIYYTSIQSEDGYGTHIWKMDNGGFKHDRKSRTAMLHGEHTEFAVANNLRRNTRTGYRIQYAI